MRLSSSYEPGSFTRYRHDRRQWDLAVLEDDRLDVPGEMVHANDGKSGCGGRGFGERETDEQGSDQTRPLGDSNRTEVRPGHLRIDHRPVDHAADVAYVLTGSEFGNHAEVSSQEVSMPRINMA